MPSTCKGRKGKEVAFKSTQTPRRSETSQGMPRNKNSTPGSMTQACPPVEYPPAHGEVLVFMRYKGDMDRRMRNCIIRMKSRIKQPGTEGTCLGVCNKVNVLESARQSDWCSRNDWCLAVFMFPSEEKAHRWYDSEPELKQPDFLPPSDGVTLFALYLRYLPQPGKLTFNWMELYDVTSRAFLQKEFVDKAASLLDDAQVNHGVIFLQDPGSKTQLYRLKESWIPHNADAHCVVNAYDSEEHFYKVAEQNNYADLRAKRAKVCDTVSLLFTIDPDITGPPSNR